MTEPRKPSPRFYRIVAVVFLILGATILWQAFLQHHWSYWVIGILTVVNAFVSAIKSLTPPEKKT